MANTYKVLSRTCQCMLSPECPGGEIATQEAERSPRLSTQDPDVEPGLGLQQEGTRWQRRASQGGRGRLDKAGK